MGSGHNARFEPGDTAMSKRAPLRTLKPRLSPMRPKLLRDTDKVRPGRSNDEPYRKLYKTARWRKLRLDVLTRDLFTCQMCGKVEVDTSKLVCDHVLPHYGDEQAFWAGPFQTLCNTPCHAIHKQKLERQGLF